MRRALLLLLLAGPLAADGFDVVSLDGPDTIEYRACRDVDGDGTLDLVLIAAGEAWMWKGRAGAIPAKPDARIALPRGAALFDFGRPRGREAEEFVVRTAEAYFALPFDGEPERLSMPSGPGLPKSSANVLWRGFFRDLDLDGKPDFVDVSLDGYRIRYAQGDEQVLPPRVLESARTAGHALSARRVARTGFGAWTDGNFNGDLRPDFAVESESGLRVYTGDAKGRFLAGRFEDIEIPDAKDAEIFYADLNLDGQTDVLSVRKKEGKAHVLVADPEQGLKKAFRFELSTPGGMRPPVLADLDGDHRPDLALPYVPRPGFADVVRVVARREFLVKVPVFLNRGGKRPFGASADTLLSLPVRVRMGADETGRMKLSGLIVVEYEGDLDGDGRKDLVVTETTEKLAVYRGIHTSVFHEEVTRHLAIPDCAPYDSVQSTAADLNGDNRSDIILHYRGGGRRPDRVHLILSRKD